MELKLGSKTVNLAGALPLTLGDGETLEKAGIDIRKGDMTMGQIVVFIGHLARKIDQTVTDDEIRKLTLPELGNAMEKIGKHAVGEVNRPS